MAPSAIHVSIPVKDAFSLGGIETHLKNGLKLAGCPACCSGIDIFLDVERDFLVNKAFSGGGAQLATRTLDRPTSTLVFDAKTDAKVDDLMAAIKNLAAFSGHAVCCSGVDISLIQFKDSMKLNVGAI
jgi:hypothetical protein